MHPFINPLFRYLQPLVKITKILAVTRFRSVTLHIFLLDINYYFEGIFTKRDVEIPYIIGFKVP